jgi:hypothetical protein
MKRPDFERGLDDWLDGTLGPMCCVESEAQGNHCLEEPHRITLVVNEMQDFWIERDIEIGRETPPTSEMGLDHHDVPGQRAGGNR